MRIVGKKVKVVKATTHGKWPLCPTLIGKVGRIERVDPYVMQPSVSVRLFEKGLLGVSFFPEELRYLNNKPVKL